MATQTILRMENDSAPAQLCFADFAGDFSPTAANDLRNGTDTEVQLTLASLADTAARMSAKADLGATWAPKYWCRLAVEMAATPTAGTVIECYWAPSTSGTAGTGNAGGVTGSDAAYTGYSSNLADSVLQLMRIGGGVSTVQATATVQVIEVGVLMPPTRYGSLIIKNETGAAVHSDDVECAAYLEPIVEQGQAS